jgi:hypothetical protein
MRRSCAPRFSVPVFGSLVLAGLVPLAACSSTTRDRTTAVKGDAPADAGAPASAVDDAAANLRSALSRTNTPAAPAPKPAPGPSPRARMEPLPQRPTEPAPKVFPEPAAAASISDPLPTGREELAARRDELVETTARTLRAWTDAGGNPALAGLQTAALAAFPGARPSTQPLGALDADQRKSVEAISGLMRDLAAQGARGLDSATAGALLAQRATELGAATPASTPDSTSAVVQTGPAPTASVLNIPTLALCRKVESFGVYEPLASATLLAGREHEMIVYTEVDGVEQRPAAPSQHAGPGFASDLTQTVMLFHDSDGVLAWSRPEVSVRDVARRQRRDYYLVQRIELPRNLTIGKYNLKVLVRDRLTGAEAEATVPINVVASVPGR